MSELATGQGARIVGEGFGQRERLTVRLRGLLRSYPRSIGIVKELLQNADDAGATRVCLIWDEREHPAEGLPDPRMSRVQGAALLFANDQLFTDADYEAIRSIGESSKASLGPKTGRFGLGFNTVYNVTDYPSFISGRWAIAFDPHHDAVASEDEPSGRRWSLEELQEGGEGWLRGFSSAGLGEGDVDFAGTIFRLPARTLAQAEESEICDEPFTRADFAQIVQDLEKVGDELLLFARNLLMIEVREVRADGTVTELLSLTTLEAERVTSNREIGNAAVEGDTRSKLIPWRADVEELPYSCYRHHIELITPKRREVRAWQVVAGLFADTAGLLLRLNEEMLDLGEKALPWVGAAVRLDLREDGSYAIGQQQGKLFCTFPLPEQPSRLPCHINGCFDLDPSRRHISTDPDLYAEADRVRVAWNKALLRHAAPRAAAIAIAALVPDAAENGMSPFFSLWPDVDRRTREPWQGFCESLLRRLSEQPLIRTRAGSTVSWSPLSATQLPPSLWGEDLLEALRDDGLSFPDPDLPRRLVRNVETAGGQLLRCKPDQVRDWLRVDEAIEVSLEQAPRACLRERSHLVDLLQFCISDQEENIAGLPLALAADGLLRAFGRGHDMYLAQADARGLFAHHRDWFIEAGIQNNTRLRPRPESGLLRMDLAQALRQLAKILVADDGETRRWDPRGEDVPNRGWITDVLRFLQAHAEALPPGALEGMTILPDHRERLHAVSSTKSHLFAFDPSEQALVDGLGDLGVVVIGAEPPHVDALRNFHRRFPATMRLLSPASLVQELASHREALLGLPGESPVRGLILDYLASASAMKAFEAEVYETLRSLPLLRTGRGENVAASQRGVYLLLDLAVPANMVSSFDTVDTGPRGRWRDLLLTLGLAELDLRNFLAELFLELYPTLAAQDQREALSWLRDTVDLRALQAAEPALYQQIRETPLIRGSDGQMHIASALYDPVNTRDLLDQADLSPDLVFYAGGDGEEGEAWVSLFTTLGVQQELRSAAIIRHIDALRARAEDDLEGAEREIRELIDWLTEAWSHLARRDPADATLLAAELRVRAWLPPLRSSSTAGFVAPQPRLYRSCELVSAGDLPLVASQIPQLDVPGSTSEFLDLLGVPEPEPEAVVAHLITLSRSWSEPDHGGLDIDDLGRSCAAIYSYLGRLSPAPDLPEAIQEVACVWDGARFWLPRQAFAVPVKDLFGERRGFVPGVDEDRHGLDRLGRRTTVARIDIATFLRELADGEPEERLSERDVAMVLRLLDRYFDSEDGGAAESDLPVPTQDGHLVTSSEVIAGDAPWFLSRLTSTSIRRLHAQVTAETIRRLGIRRLSSVVREELAEAPALSGSADKVAFCQELAATIHHPLFAEGIGRLTVMGGDPDEPFDATVLQSLRLRAVDRLVTHLRIEGVPEPFGRQEVAILADHSASTLYISADHWSTVVVTLSETINQVLGRRIDNLAHLEALLQTPTSEIREVLDHRKVPRLQGLEDPAGDDDVAESELSADELPPPVQAIGIERLAVVTTQEVSRRVTNEVAKGALLACLAFEEEAGRNPAAMPPETLSYDIQSGRISDTNARFIRVYGLDLSWDRLPVILSHRDAVAARTFGRQYWLYVVERARDPLRRRIFRLQDPLPRIASYALDQRWREHAEADGLGHTPRAGWVHHPETGEPAEILAVERVGMFTWLKVRVGDEEERRFFRPALDRLSLPE